MRCPPPSLRAFLPRGVAARTRLARRRCLRRLSVARLLLFPFRIFIRRGPRGTSLLASCGTDCTSLQDFISRTHITKRMTALTEYPAREEEFGTTRLAQGAAIAGPSVRAQVLPLFKCTSARRDRRGAQRSLDLTVRHSDSRRPAAPVPSPKKRHHTQRPHKVHVVLGKYKISLRPLTGE